MQLTQGHRISVTFILQVGVQKEWACTSILSVESSSIGGGSSYILQETASLATSCCLPPVQPTKFLLCPCWKPVLFSVEPVFEPFPPPWPMAVGRGRPSDASPALVGKSLLVGHGHLPSKFSPLPFNNLILLLLFHKRRLV